VDAEEMKRRTNAFAAGIVRLTRTVPKTTESRVIMHQLLRSGTSVGANYRAACLARSRADFTSKLGIVIEEADESHYWMGLMVETGMCRHDAVTSLMREAAELTSIFIASVKTARPVK